jgi:hypothetical protein
MDCGTHRISVCVEHDIVHIRGEPGKKGGSNSNSFSNQKDKFFILQFIFFSFLYGNGRVLGGGGGVGGFGG